MLPPPPSPPTPKKKPTKKTKQNNNTKANKKPCPSQLRGWPALTRQFLYLFKLVFVWSFWRTFLCWLQVTWTRGTTSVVSSRTEVRAAFSRGRLTRDLSLCGSQTLTRFGGGQCVWGVLQDLLPLHGGSGHLSWCVCWWIEWLFPFLTVFCLPFLSFWFYFKLCFGFVVLSEDVRNSFSKGHTFLKAAASLSL